MTYSDPVKWLEEGWVDYLAPQLYWIIEDPQQSFPVLLNWWTEQNLQAKHLYPGIALYKTKTKDWPISKIQAQVEVTREFAPQLSLGNIFFRMDFLKEKKTSELFKTTTYPRPALPPVMPWKVQETSIPPPVVNKSTDGHLSWQAEENSRVWQWTLYQQTDQEWTLVRISNAETTETEVPLGTYALCAVSRESVESIGIRITKAI